MQIYNTHLAAAPRRRSKPRALALCLTPCVAAIQLLLAAPAMAQSGLFDLGVFNGGQYSSAYGVNADGSVVVGYSEDGLVNENRAFRWTQAAGMVSLGTLNGGRYSYATGVSADGRIVVGYAMDGGLNTERAFRWTQADGMVSLGGLNGGIDSTASGVSADGSVVVGEASNGAEGGRTRAFRWTQSGGMVSLGGLNGGPFSRAIGVSADGSVVIGSAPDGAMGNERRAFRWTQGGGMISLGTLNAGHDSYAEGASADGRVVVGGSQDGSAGNQTRAFRWTQGGGMVGLGAFNGGTFSIAHGVNADGSVVVGRAADGSLVAIERAFRWTQAKGLQTVEQWLRDGGVAVPVDVTYDATAVSADGKTVVGELWNNGHPFIARLTPQGGGMMDVVNYNASLAGAGNVTSLALNGAEMVMHGAHGSPMRGRVAAGQSAFWANGDVGNNGHDRFGGNLASAEIGLAHNWGNGLQGNLALGHQSETQGLELGGETRMRGTYLMPELIWQATDSLYATFSGYYNSGSASVRRGYWNAGLTDYSRGDTGTEVMALRARLDWLDAWKLGDANLTPYTSLTATRAKVDGYTESGGGFPARWNGRSESATVLRAGVDAALPVSGNVNLLGRLELANRFQGAGSTATGEILGLSGFGVGGQAQRKSWLRTGVGLEGKVGQAGIVSLMLNATTQGSAPAYWLAAGYRMSF
jgi:probable HAF family extracellular repeat protein